MSGLILIIILFLILGGILKFAFSATKMAFKLTFWLIGLAFGVIGFLIKFGFLVVLGFLIVGIVFLILSRRKL